jgi:hypothetical protein
MRLFRRVRSWLRGTPAQPPTIVNVGRAVVFGDEVDAARTAKEWALAERERREREEFERRAAASAAQIAKAVRENGIWLPPSHRGERR